MKAARPAGAGLPFTCAAQKHKAGGRQPPGFFVFVPRAQACRRGARPCIRQAFRTRSTGMLSPLRGCALYGPFRPPYGHTPAAVRPGRTLCGPLRTPRRGGHALHMRRTKAQSREQAASRLFCIRSAGAGLPPRRPAVHYASFLPAPRAQSRTRGRQACPHPMPGAPPKRPCARGRRAAASSLLHFSVKRI